MRQLPQYTGSRTLSEGRRTPLGWSFHQRYRSFRAARNAFAALMAVIGPHDIGRHSSMRRAAQLAEHVQRVEVLSVHSAYLENIVRTDPNTIAFGFAAPMVDDRNGGHVHLQLEIVRLLAESEWFAS